MHTDAVAQTIDGYPLTHQGEKVIESSLASACQWGAVNVGLGNIRRAVESIEGVQAQFKDRKLPMNSSLLNYGYFHQSTLEPVDRIVQVVAGTLAAANLEPDCVDMVVVAAAQVEFLTGDRKFVSALLEQAGLTNALPLVITGQECTALLSALDLAWRYVRQGRFRNIVVVCCDEVRSEDQRVQSFGVISDAAVACVVSAERPLGFTVRRFSHRADLSGMRGRDDVVSRKSLIESVTTDVLGHEYVALSDVRKVFATNFFRPLATFNASCQGIAPDQLYSELTSETGHCLCADPLLNFAAFLQDDSTGGRGELHLLEAFAPGFLAAMLVERVADVPLFAGKD
jgi:3-oxoacyl-[acyl-carrier-protein] synthase III